jgi:hypothetical protein
MLSSSCFLSQLYQRSRGRELRIQGTCRLNHWIVWLKEMSHPKQTSKSNQTATPLSEWVTISAERGLPFRCVSMSEWDTISDERGLAFWCVSLSEWDTISNERDLPFRSVSNEWVRYNLGWARPSLSMCLYEWVRYNLGWARPSLSMCLNGFLSQLWFHDYLVARSALPNSPRTRQG